MEPQEYFASKKVYQLISSNGEYLFVCLPVQNSTMGKLVQYKTDTPNKPGALYEETGVSYLLNAYIAGDIRALFLDVDNYELVGEIGENFELTQDKKFLHNLIKESKYKKKARKR